MLDEIGSRLPALLLEWGRRGRVWEGRVVRPLVTDGVWVPAEAWLPAERIEGAGAAPPPPPTT